MAPTTTRPLLPELSDWLRSTGAGTTFATADEGPRPDPSVPDARLIVVTGDPAAVDEGGATGLRLAAPEGIVSDVTDVAGATVEDATTVGEQIADRAADDATPLLVLGLPDVTATTAAAVIGTVCNLEPVKAHSPAGRTDHGWSAEVAEIRDLMFGMRSLRRAPSDHARTTAVLGTVGSPALAAAVGLLSHAAERRTPVVLDGTATLAAALLAESAVSGSARWWLAPHCPTGQGPRAALDRLRLRPVHDRDLGATGGGAGICVLPLLRAAAVATA
jgi:nicotinate-nucleotide--dimethylbenzimidazole phosphoribosyltransferase